MCTCIRRARYEPRIFFTSATSIPTNGRLAKSKDTTLSTIFAKTSWPTEKGAFSFNIDPSPSKQFLRLHRDDEHTKAKANLSFSRRPEEELYDLAQDPEQLNNVVGDPKYAKARLRLRRKLDAELIKSNDPQLVLEAK